jgi:hypothetical protein
MSATDIYGSALDSADVRQRDRELADCDVLGQLVAASYRYSFLPPGECRCPHPRLCRCRPELVTIGRRPNVPMRTFARHAGPVHQCDHRNGVSVPGCPSCTLRHAPDKVLRPSGYHLMAGELIEPDELPDAA